MKALIPLLFVLITILSCSPAKNFQNHYGLTFKDLDWKDGKLERPFLINSDVSNKLTESEKKLYLPARLFENTIIEHVFFNGMKSDSIEMIDGEKPRYQIYFNKKKHEVLDLPYELKKDEAVVKIKVVNNNEHQKLIKIQDIRVPFYN